MSPRVRRLTALRLLSFVLPTMLASSSAFANKAPEVKDQTFDIDEDGKLSAALKANDGDNDPLQFKMLKPPKNGEAVVETNGKFTYTPKKDWHGTDELTFEVSDGKAKVQRKAIIQVLSVNDPPTPGKPVELMGQEDKQVRGQVTATDPDKDQIIFSVGDDPPHGSVDVDGKTGKFVYTPGPNKNGTVKFSIRASDGSLDVKIPVTVGLEAVNDPPTARDDKVKGKEDEQIKGKLLAEDVDNEPLTYTVAEPPAHGKVVIDPQKGTFVYTPAKDYAGNDAFSFTVSDGKASAKGRISLEVLNVNDPPSIQPLALEGLEDQPIKGKVIGTDPDGDDVYYTMKVEPQHGEVDLDRTTGQVTYTPKPDFHGNDKFTIEASDIGGGVATVVTVTVKPVNDPPVTSSGSAEGEEDKPINGKLRATDVDKDGLSFSLTRPAKNGSVDLKPDGTWRYTPNANFYGEDVFAFEVSDGKAKAGGTMSLTVKPVNDPPVTADVKLDTNEDTVVRGKVPGSDLDKDRLNWTLGKKAKKGRVNIDEETGAFAYQPNANENGEDSFSVKVSDGTAEVESTVTIAIAPVNDAPVAERSENKGDEDQPIKGKVTGTDVDKDALTYTVIGKPRSGNVEMDASTGNYTYTPNANFYGPDSFKFEVSDGKLRSAAEVVLTIAPVNDAPEPKDVAVNTIEDKAVTGTVPATDIDKDKLTWTLGKAPQKGTVTVDEATGRFTYTPKENENGDDSFTVIVKDGKAQAEAKVTVAIAPVNDAPVAIAGENKGDEDQPIKGKVAGTDVDKDTLTYSVATKPRAGNVEIDPGTGAYTYTPNAHYNGEDSFRFEVSDGKLKSTAEVKLTIAAVNDPPDVKNVALNTLEDKAVTGAVPASDVDKDKLTWTLGKGPSKGAAVVDEQTGKLTYTPKENENGEDSFVVVVSDGKAKSEATVTVAIAPVNDTPVAEAHENRGKEDEPIKGKLVASDVDKDALTFSAATKPRSGTVEIDASTGNYTYTPNANFNGEDSFRFEASDGKLKATAEVKLSVAAVNDPPESKELVLSTTEDRDVSGKILATDVDKDVLTFRLKKAPQKGQALVDDATGAVRYTPARDVHGEDAFVVEVTDGYAVVDTNVKVTIAPVPDAPIVDARGIETAEDEAVSVKLAAIDPDGAEVTFKILTQSKLGTAEVDGSGTTLKFTPRPDVHGEDEIVVEASNGKNKTRAVLPVRIAARNDPPTIDEVKAETLEETPIDIVLLARDKDGDAVKIALADKPPASADVKLTGSILQVAPKKDFAGVIELSVVASDPTTKGPPTKVVVTVKNVNDAPTAKDMTIKADPDKAVSGTIEASDVDAGDELTFSVAVGPKQGNVVLDDASKGRFTYTAAPSARGEDSFRIRVRDKAGASVTATVKVTIGGGKPVARR
jgi:large repetitive protein